MKVSLQKRYRTRNGRDVRLYATDGGGRWPVHGATFSDGIWKISTWNEEGLILSRIIGDLDLVEVTYAEQLAKQIPWSAIKDGYNAVAMDADGYWRAWRTREGHVHCIHPDESSGKWLFNFEDAGMGAKFLVTGMDAVKMPRVPRDLWQESKVIRPKQENDQ